MSKLKVSILGAALVLLGVSAALSTQAAARTTVEFPEVTGVRAHADGSVSLSLSLPVPTECAASNAPVILPGDTNRAVVDLAYKAFETNRFVTVNLAPGCTATGQPIVESVEVSNRTGRMIRENL